MPRESDARLRLAEYLTELQAELSKARAQSELDDSRFSVDAVTLEVDISYTLTRSAKSPATMQPEFWVLGSGARKVEDAAGSTHRDAQHLIVRLSPKLEAADADESEEVATIPLLPPTRLSNAE